MSSSPTPDRPWERFFGTAEAPLRLDIPVGLVRRGGRAFLVLPQHPQLAAKSLDLFPAQSGSARLARSVFRMMLRVGFRPRIEPLKLRLSSHCPFGRFLAEVAGTGSVTPSWAMLAGNPGTEGQRCIFLLFNDRREPVAVVKAGAGGRARELIDHEAAFLKSAPPGVAGLPAIRSTFASGEVSAFAMNFCAGDSPRRADAQQVGQLLCAWVRPQPAQPLRQLAPWQRLRAVMGSGLPVPVQKAEDAAVRPVLFHGDFTPWNVKDDGGQWTVLDWERGELAGVPLWDWLHFVVQPAILVEKLDPGAVVGRLDQLFGSEPFRRYEAQAGIGGMARTLAQAYLQYNIRILQPSEGLDELKQVSAAAAQRWL